MEQDYSTSPELAMMQSRIREMAKHMQHIGLLTILLGGLCCLSIIGAIWGIPYIISGLRLRESADSYQAFSAMNDPRQLLTAFEKQSSYFFIIKVLMLIGVAFTVLYFIVIIFALFAGADFFDF